MLGIIVGPGEFFSLGRMPRSKTEIQDQKQRKIIENP
jgi:hypothetical protein